MNPLAGACHDCDAFLPNQACQLLGKASFRELRLGDMVERILTVMFIDIRGFTSIAEIQRPVENLRFLNRYLAEVVPVIEEHGGLIDKFIGDAVMVLFGDTPERAVACGQALIDRLERYNRSMAGQKGFPIQVGIGVNTGFLVLGVVGTESRSELTVVGDTVNLASRMENLTKIYGASLLISGQTYQWLENTESYQIRFLDRIFVKGKRVPQAVYEVCSADEPALRKAKRDNLPLFHEAVAHFHFRKGDEAVKLFRDYSERCPGDRAADAYLSRCQGAGDSSLPESVGLEQHSVAWGDDLRLGHVTIDAQHQELFAQADHLMDMIAAEDFTGIQDVVRFLARYIGEHFATEEAAMRQAGYPFLAEHVNQHRLFTQAFSRLVDEFMSVRQSRVYMAFRLQILVIDWLQNHIQKTDQHFGRYLALMSEK